MKKPLACLKGKKTYIVAGLIFILGGLKALGLIDDEAYLVLIGLFNAAGLASLRNSLK